MYHARSAGSLWPKNYGQLAFHLAKSSYLASQAYYGESIYYITPYLKLYFRSRVCDTWGANDVGAGMLCNLYIYKPSQENNATFEIIFK